MATLKDALDLATSLRRGSEPWATFCERNRIKSIDAKTLQRWNRGDVGARGPLQFKIDGFYDELLACQAAPSQSVRHRPTLVDRLLRDPSLQEGTPMDQRRLRFLRMVADYLANCDTPEDIQRAGEGAVAGAMAAMQGGDGRRRLRSGGRHPTSQ